MTALGYDPKIMNEKMPVSWVYITPEDAAEILKKNIPGNRKISAGKKKDYARDQRAGQWQPNGATIVFDEAGWLLDGQHRLLACIESGCGFWTVVVRNVPRAYVTTMDRNMTRTPAQMLRIVHQNSDPKMTCAVLNWLFYLRVDEGTVVQAGHPMIAETLELFDAHPDIHDSVSRGKQVARKFNAAGPPSLVGFCHYVFSQQSRTLAELFFDALENGAGLHITDPVYSLRERLIHNQPFTRRTKHAMNQTELLALYFKTWNAEKEKRPIRHLRWSAAMEAFPSIGPVRFRA